MCELCVPVHLIYAYARYAINVHLMMLLLPLPVISSLGDDNLHFDIFVLGMHRAHTHTNKQTHTCKCNKTTLGPSLLTRHTNIGCCNCQFPIVNCRLPPTTLSNRACNQIWTNGKTNISLNQITKNAKKILNEPLSSVFKFTAIW